MIHNLNFVAFWIRSSNKIAFKVFSELLHVVPFRLECGQHEIEVQEYNDIFGIIHYDQEFDNWESCERLFYP